MALMINQEHFTIFGLNFQIPNKPDDFRKFDFIISIRLNDLM